MSNIQQSINQMLYAGTIGAGLYSQSPAGKAAHEKYQARKAEKAEAEAKKKGDVKTAEAAAKEKQKYLSRAAAADPTYANLSLLTSATEQVGPTATETKTEGAPYVPKAKTGKKGEVLGTRLSTKEGRAIKSLYDRDKTLVEQKEYFRQLMGDVMEYDMEVKEYGQ